MSPKSTPSQGRLSGTGQYKLDDPHWHRERDVFLHFARAAGVQIDAATLCRGQGYDLDCCLIDGQRVAFELTEIADQGAAVAFGNMLTTGSMLHHALNDPSSASAAAVRQRYQGWDLAVWLHQHVGSRILRPQLEPLLAWLASLSPELVDRAPVPAGLTACAARVTARRIPDLPAMISAPGHAIWMADQTVATIRAKFAKNYPRGIGLQLLAYFGSQPERPDAVHNARSFLEAWMEDGQAIERVWVYSIPSNAVLLQYP
jgi:hypothetical protein